VGDPTRTKNSEVKMVTYQRKTWVGSIGKKGLIKVKSWREWNQRSVKGETGAKHCGKNNRKKQAAALKGEDSPTHHQGGEKKEKSRVVQYGGP